MSVTKWCIVGYRTGALWDLCQRSNSIDWTYEDHSCGTIWHMLLGHNEINEFEMPGWTLLVLKPEYMYSGRSSSVPWLLNADSLALASPRHKQPWYWFCRSRASLLSIREDFEDLCHLNVEKLFKKRQIYFMFPKANSPRLRLVKLSIQWSTDFS